MPGADPFAICLEFILSFEGGYTNRASDPGNWTGGATGVGVCKGTNFGISAKAYPDLDIINLTREQAAAIYFRDYWTPLHCGEMPLPVALVMFDTGVNMGLHYAATELQNSAGLPADGDIGPVTLGAVRNQSPPHLVAAYLASRIETYVKLSAEHPEFLSGWTTRVICLAITVGGLVRAN